MKCKHILNIVIALSIIFTITGCGIKKRPALINQPNKLAEWLKGVWITGIGTYTIYTGNHYFVISNEGDSLRPNLYFGASQVKYTDKGMARKQVLRYRQVPNNDPTIFRETDFQSDHTEAPLVIDTTLFNGNTCTVKDGIIYDVIIEQTDEYILLATCNGDKEKIYSNGVYVYLPAGGGEYYSYRVEKF
jgi:hypothetical protein